MACILANVLAKGQTLPRLQVWGDVIIEKWQHKQKESTDALKRPLIGADAATGPEVQGGWRGPGKAAVPGHLAGVEECAPLTSLQHHPQGEGGSLWLTK